MSSGKSQHPNKPINTTLILRSSIAKYPLQNKGIYKNLPQFDPDVKGLTAIVTGANGTTTLPKNVPKELSER